MPDILTDVSTALGVTDIIANNPGGKLNDLNAATQLGLIASTVSDKIAPHGPALTLVISQAALATGGAAIINDFVKGESLTNKFADGLSEVGDLVTFVGACASDTSEGKIFGAEMEELGDTINLVGLGIRNYDTVVRDIPIAYDELVLETHDEIDEIEKTINTDLGSISQYSASYNIQAGLSGVLNGLTSAADSIGTSLFDADLKTLNYAVTNANYSALQLYNQIGLVSQGINEYVEGDYLKISSSDAGVAPLSVDGNFGEATTLSLDTASSFGTGLQSIAVGADRIASDTSTQATGDSIQENAQVTYKNLDGSSVTEDLNNGLEVDRDELYADGSSEIVHREVNNDGTQSVSIQNTNNTSTIETSTLISEVNPTDFKIDSAGDISINIGTAGDTLDLSHSGQDYLLSSEETVINQFAQGDLAYVAWTATHDAVLGSVAASGNAGQLLQLLELNGDGSSSLDGVGYSAGDGNFNADSDFASLDAVSLRSSLDSFVDADPAQGPTGDAFLSEIEVDPLTTSYFDDGDSTDLSGYDYGDDFGIALAGPGIEVLAPDAGLDGTFYESPSDITLGDYLPGESELIGSSQSDTDLIDGWLGTLYGGDDDDDDGGDYGSDLYAPVTDAQASNGGSGGDHGGGWSSVVPEDPGDPLLLDLTGKGIKVTNWINDDVYFRTDVKAADGAYTLDSALHHTSWMNGGVGMLVYDPHKTAITDLTQTVSEYLNVSGKASSTQLFADGLAALASLSNSATVFSQATSRVDPLTGQLYWNEILVATGNPDATGAIPVSQLESLASAGIASISLAGTGNAGKSVAGSAIINSGTYTTTGGASRSLESVNLQTNTAGDVIVDSGGQVEITSTPEGGATAATSFVDKGAAGSSWTLAQGTLARNGATAATGITGFFATNQDDETITIAAKDASTYWLGGGTGVATLDASAAAGNIMFLVNARTTVKGGSGFNIAQVIDTGPVTIDLATAGLQEVVGGAGDGTFNASGTQDNVFIQGGSGSNIIIGGYGLDALAGGTGDDLIEAGSGGSIIHAGKGNDVIYGGFGEKKSGSTYVPNSDVIYAGAGNDVIYLGLNNSAVFAGPGTATVIGQDTLRVPNTQLKPFSEVNFSGSYVNYTLTKNSDGTTTVIDKTGRDGEVTLKDVTDIGFSDIGAISMAAAPPLPLNDTVVISGNEASYTIAVSTLTANDFNYTNPAYVPFFINGANGGIRPGHETEGINGGTIHYNTDGTLTFTPDASFQGVATFRYYYTDTNGGASVSVQHYDASNKPVGKPVVYSGTVTVVTPNEPTDPGFANEWYLQTADVLPAWKAGFTGKGISVAVFDPSGNVDFSNPDFASHEGGVFDAPATPGTGQIGTYADAVAGVLAAADDGEGNIGIANGATLSSESVSGATGSGITAALLQDWSRYDIVNNSWAGLAPYIDATPNAAIGDAAIDSALSNAVLKGRNGLGTVVVFSSGNGKAQGGDSNQSRLTASPYEITVGGIDDQAPTGDAATELANTGVTSTTPGASVLVCAPSYGINTDGTVKTNEYGQEFGTPTEDAAGSSMAAPIVSGVIALMLQANPDLGARDVQEILADTAVVQSNGSDAGTTNKPNHATNWNGGGMHVTYDYGFGMVDAAAAVRLAQTWSAGDTFGNDEIYSVTKTAVGSYTTSQIGNGSVTSIDSAATLLTGAYDYNAAANGLYTRTSNNAYIDFNFATLQADPIDVEHVDVTVAIQFTSLTVSTASDDATEQASLLAQANAMINQLTVVVSGGSTFSTLMSPITHAGNIPAGAVIKSANDVDTPEFDYTFDTVRDWNESDLQDFRLYVSVPPGATSSVVTSATVSVEGSPVASGQGQVYIYTDQFATTSSVRSVLSDSGYGVILNASAVSGTSKLDLAPGSTDSNIEGRSLAIASNTHIAKAYGSAGGTAFSFGNGTYAVYGGSGSDSYAFDAGDGDVTIGDAGGADTLKLGTGLVAGTLNFAEDGSTGNLVITDTVSPADRITIVGGLGDPAHRLESVCYNGGATAVALTLPALTAGSAIDLPAIAFSPTLEVVFTASLSGGILQIVDTAQGNAVMGIFALPGSYGSGVFTLTNDGYSGTSLGFRATPAIGLAPGTREVTSIPGGSPLATLDQFNSDGSLNRGETITVSNYYDFHFAGGSFFAGKSFASFDNITNAAGRLLSQSLYDTNGTTTQQTSFNSDGTIYLQGKLIKLANGGRDYRYDTGTYFAGQPFTYYDDIYMAPPARRSMRSSMTRQATSRNRVHTTLTIRCKSLIQKPRCRMGASATVLREEASSTVNRSRLSRI